MPRRFHARLALFAIAFAPLVAEGCSGKKRPFGDGPLDDEQRGALLPGAGFAGGGTRALGAECAIDSGCDSGFCVAGRCCDNRCDGLCEACSDAGLCNDVPADDLRCTALTCGLGSACATYPATQATNRCESRGVCKIECDPLSVSVDLACAEVAPGISGLCSAAGDCLDPRAEIGAACNSTIDCTQGACVDGVCCAEACNGPCETCNANGECIAAEARTACGDGLQCFGRGACLAPNGSTCQLGTECGSGNCVAAVGGGSVCCAEPCATGLACNGDGQCVTPDSDLGAPCVADGDCIGGRCFDGVCCDSECGGSCEQCNAPGQLGRCGAAPAESADVACDAGRLCAGRGQCLLPLGASCSLNGECLSGECGAALAGGGVCCDAVCADGQRCSATGSCVDAPRADGNACVSGTDCQSGSCVGGRCCESACDGTCQACSGLGDCNVNPGNDDRCAAIDCPATTTVCATYPADVATSLCAAFGACRNAEQACQPVFAARGTPCEELALGVRGQCDGAGTCSDPRVGLGVACSSAAECRSGNCVNGVCCDTTCNGVCEACSASGVCGLRDNGLCPVGQQCATRATCPPRIVEEGASCANGEACDEGVCVAGTCRGVCRLATAADTSGSRFDNCVLAQ